MEGREERGGVGTATPGESQKPGQFESCPRRPVRPPQATEDVSELPELGSRGGAHEAGFQGRKGLSPNSALRGTTFKAADRGPSGAEAFGPEGSTRRGP